jgi:hypothetical protein
MEVTVCVAGARLHNPNTIFTTPKYTAEIRLSSAVLRTQSRPGPEIEWNEAFKLEADMKDVMQVRLSERTLLGGERELGRVDLRVGTAVESGDSWWTVMQKRENVGMLHLQVTSSDHRTDYLRRILELDAQKEEVKFLKRKYLQKIEKAKIQKRACQRRLKELDLPSDTTGADSGSASPSLPTFDLERKREHLSFGEEQLLKDKLALQAEKEQLAREEEQLLKARELIAAERRKLRIGRGSPEDRQVKPVETAAEEGEIQKENCQQPGLKTPSGTSRGLRTPLSRRLLMTTSSNRLLSFV